MTVRTRIAPSPTGDPHVGTAYAALINYLYAKHHGGDFVLRIEDTDRVRSTAASESVIIEALHWLGVTWDEGPDIGGPHGPYRQSERLAIYAKYAQVLLDAGHAFKCFCTPERLDAMRREQERRKVPTGYDGHCLELDPSEIAANEAAGKPFTVRLKVPREGTCTIHDLMRGQITFDWHTVDMQILVKSDGWPTYHLANVVDDHLMEISHVLRGEEWLSSAPKHALLYEYFGWKMPELGHLPLLRNADRSKLSKRKNPTSILFYKRMGYLPEAFANFLGLFSVPPPDGEEIMDMPTMVGRFGLDHISLGGPIFDLAKLDWLNGRYIRERLDAPAFSERVREWALNAPYLEAIASLAQSRIERLSDLGPLTSFLFAGRLQVAKETLLEGKLDGDTVRKLFVLALDEFDRLESWELPTIEGALRRLAANTGVKFRDLVRPFYVAVSGQPTSLPLFNSMELLGRDIVRERVRNALEVLGGASSAERELWKKESLAEPALDSAGADVPEPVL
jgi:glutamyl-tRNA synthetase